MRITFLIAALAALVSWTGAGAEKIQFARYPEISPDGSRIAFSYGGDIWIVAAAGGSAMRITDHVAYDGYPVWSPDGGRLAFASDRFGSLDVFVVSAGGGEATRLTYHSSSDIPCDWNDAGDAVVFQTRRFGSEDLWLAPVGGGTPVRLSGVWLEREAYADLSNDGTRIVYNNNRCTSGWWRRHFDSSDAADIYISDFAIDGIRPSPLMKEPYHDLWPHFSPDDTEVFFVSGRTGVLNVFRMPAAGGEARQVTQMEKDVQWLSVSRQNGTLAFSSGFDLFTLPVEGGAPRRVSIFCATDFKENQAEQKTLEGGASEFRVSPDGKKTAFVVHGEIFVGPAEKGGIARRITHTPWRESGVMWLADSRRIVYSSDRNGALDLFTADTKTGEETLLTGGETNDSRPIPSPDGEWIAFYRGNHAIYRVKSGGGDPEKIVTAKFLDLRLESTAEFSWSPDSRWIAYAAYAPDFHMDIHVRNIEEGTDSLVSYLATYNHRPVWSPDGAFLYFTSYFRENGDTYRVRLAEKEPKYDEDLLDSLYEEPATDEGEEDEEEKAEKEPEPVVIDFRDIFLRVEAFPDLANDESEPVFPGDGKRVVFAANVMGEGSHDLWSYPAGDEEKEKKLKQLTSSEKRKSRLQAVGDAVWYLEGGKVKWFDTAKEKGGSFSFQAEMEIDAGADRRQMFLEAWSLLNDQFYDPAFHGAPWAEIKEEYGAIVPHTRTTRDFHTLIRMMIGELSASHLNIWDPRSKPPRETGYLGIEFDRPRTADGVFRVASVVPEGPAALDESRVEPGEYVLSVDGVKLGDGVNLSALLEGKVGRRVELEVARSVKGGGARAVRIKPVDRSAEIRLQYDEWDRERRRLVDRWSDGRLAYLHIRGMGAADLDRFRRELVTIAEKKEGAVVDVRYNGGGWISVHLLGILGREPFLLRNFRGEPFTREAKMRSYAYGKPMALLIHNHSYSNAEIFAEGWRRLDLGPIVGTATAGSVIGTGSWTLIDGSTFRKPSWGAYTLEGENLENHGRLPDYEIDNDYNDWMDGRDPQLEKAVRLLLDEIDAK